MRPKQKHSSTTPERNIERLAATDEVQAFADEARAEGRIALDTEFLWERTYSPVPCLVQVATTQRVVLVDPIEGGDLRPIAQLVGDPGVELLMHAPSADLLLFERRFGTRATNVFDVQLAAGFLGLGTSSAYDRLVESVLGIRLEHNETFTNWSKRPLSAAQVAYAADDVVHLHALAAALRRDIDRRERGQWLQDELDRRYGGRAAAREPGSAYQKVARRGRLTGRQLTVLREVAAWREREAEAKDLPAGWVVKDPTLVEIARTAPRDPEALANVRGVSGLSATGLGRLLAAVEDGLAAEPLELPRPPAPDLRRRVAAASELAAVVLRVRCDAADLASELVATRGELESYVEAVATQTVDGHPLAAGWRHDLVGAELRELVEGRVVLAALPCAPYLKISPR